MWSYTTAFDTVTEGQEEKWWLPLAIDPGQKFRLDKKIMVGKASNLINLYFRKMHPNFVLMGAL